MPEDLIKKLKNNVPTQWKVCFWSAVVMGLVAHFYKITNWLPNWDSLVFRYDAQNMFAMGRWFLPVACAPSSFYDLPWVAGLLAILFHALGAICICRIFSVEKKITAALIGATVVTFPTVTSVLAYNYVADGYALAFLLSCLAVVFMVGQKPRWWASVLCIALSAGIYQAYLTVTIMLLLCYLTIAALNESTKLSYLFVKVLKFLATGACGMVLYYLVMTVVLKLTGTALLEYQGIGSAASLSGIDLLGSLYTVKETFVDYLFDFSAGANAFGIINCVVCVATVVFYVIDAIRNRTSPTRVLTVGVLVALLPVGACALAFINCQVDYHNLMKMGFYVFYLFFILQYERLDFKKSKLNSVKAWTVLGVTLVLVFNYIIIANVCYHKLNIAYEKSLGVLNRIADRIEQTEGAENCDRLLVVGALEGSEEYSVDLPPDMTGFTDGYILRADDEIVGQSVLCSAINDYCGKSYKFVYGEEKRALIDRIDEGSYEIWPAENSILVIDNIIVIRLGSEGK